MTGAPDGDVDRALAAMGATPLKYYSFGVVAVRPPEVERARSDNLGPDRAGFPFGMAPLPPSGEGTAERYRSHSVASVFPLLGLALPEAFHIDVEPVWPVGPSVSEHSVIFDRSTAHPASGTGHTQYELADRSKLPANVDIFPHEAVKSSPSFYATPPDGESQASSANGGVFVMPAWLDPASAANEPLSEPVRPSAAPLPWLDNVANVSPLEPVRPPPTAGDVLPDWGRRPNISAEPPLSQPTYGASLYSPFVQNDVNATNGPFENTNDIAAKAEQPLPPWLQEADSPSAVESPSHKVDWSLPKVTEHRPDDFHQPSSTQSATESLSAHPMPAFAPPPILHNSEPQPLRPSEYEEPLPLSVLPEPIPHDPVSPNQSHVVTYPFGPRHHQTDGFDPEQNTHFASEHNPFSAADAEPTWHEPPAEQSHPDFVEVNKPHFAATEITNENGTVPLSFGNTYEFSDPWDSSGHRHGSESGIPAVTPEQNASHSDMPAPLFAAFSNDTPPAPAPAPKPKVPVSSRPLSDLFRTLGAARPKQPDRRVGQKSEEYQKDKP